MTPQEKKKAFDAAVKAGVKERTRIQANTRDEIVRLLQVAQEQIAITLASQPTDYQRWSLPDLQFEITRMLKEFGESGAAVIGTAAGESWQAGQDLMDKPLIAAQASNIVGMMPRLDPQQLNAMRAFMTDRIKDIGVQGANKINSELGLVVIGAQSPGDAIGRVKDILGEPSRARATTIVRTQLGAAFSKASHERMNQAKQIGVPLEKEWIRSGKLHPRVGHNMAHGQRVPVDQPFLIPSSKGGAAIRMMYPHDPAAPASEIINCGCTAIPRVDFSQPITPSGFVSGVKRTLPAEGLTNAQNYEQASTFADQKGLSAGKGVTAKSTIAQYASEAFTLNAKSRLMEIGGTEKWYAIKQATGVDVGGYKTVLDAEKLKHIHNTHGVGNERDKKQRAVTEADIAKIPDILASYDKVSLSKTDRGLDALKFEKTVDGELFTYVTEVRTGRKHLAPATMYIKKNLAGE